MKAAEKKHITPETLEKKEEYWSWWMHRILVYTGRKAMNWEIHEEGWLFRDAADAEVILGEDEINELEIYTR